MFVILTKVRIYFRFSGRDQRLEILIRQFPSLVFAWAEAVDRRGEYMATNVNDINHIVALCAELKLGESMSFTLDRLPTSGFAAVLAAKTTKARSDNYNVVFFHSGTQLTATCKKGIHNT